MRKNSLEPFDEEKPYIETERLYIYRGSRSFGWKQWLFLAILLGAAILFAFGFLILAAFLFLGWIVFSLVAFVIRKLS